MQKNYQKSFETNKQNFLIRILDLCYSNLKLLFFFDENRINTDLTFQEKHRLMSLARKCSGSVYVEIGTYVGASACFIAAGIGKSAGSKLYCIDTWLNESMTEGERDTFSEFKKNTAKYKNQIVPCRGKSQELAVTFNNKIDFLFVDGDHSYEGVRTDVTSWFPKLNAGALVLFHDVGWAEGVQRVINETVRPRAKSEGGLPNLYWAWL
jgi:predicted O-methyltransferase YrrM